MELTQEQTEKLRKLAQSCGTDLVHFFNLMILEISDIRTDLKVDPSIEKDLRKTVIKLFEGFTEKIKQLSSQEEPKGEDRFD